MKAPGFWQSGAFPAGLLAPLGAVTQAITARRVARPGWRAPVPVLCVGNATVGGTGKTPLVGDLAARLQRSGKAVHVLLRGHGGMARGPLRVDPTFHDAAEVGDEALLLASVAPCWVGADRAASARAAVADGAALLLMDDGLQNPALTKDISLLVVDGGAGFGNGLLLPAGPLREKVEAAAARCQVAVIIGADRHHAVAHLPATLPVLRASLAPTADMRAWAGEKVLAFAGIGRPDKFFATLGEAGLVVIASQAFADHHRYGADELQSLRRAAAAHGARLVTTTKDFARLPHAGADGITALAADLVWDDTLAIDSLLATMLP